MHLVPPTLISNSDNNNSNTKRGQDFKNQN